MSNSSNNQGRAYEYICLLTLEKEINQYRTAVVEHNSSFEAAQNAWLDALSSLREEEQDAHEGII